MEQSFTHELLVKVREKLATPDRWTQNAGARFFPGGPLCSRNDPLARCWCLLIAIDLCAEGNLKGAWLAKEALLLFTQRQELWVWNDDPKRTHADVVRVLDQAIEATRAA